MLLHALLEESIRLLHNDIKSPLPVPSQKNDPLEAQRIALMQARDAPEKRERLHIFR